MLRKERGILGVLAALCILIAWTNPDFYRSAYNLQNLSRHIALLALFAFGEAFVIISGGIDLSVGSIIGFVGLLVAVLAVRMGVPITLAIAAGLALSVGVGLGQGLLITRLGLQPFIVTLGGMMVLRGLAQTISEGSNIGFGNEFAAFKFLGTGSVMGVPVPVLVLLVVGAVALMVLHRTVFGRHLFAIGGNIDAARFSGIRVHRVSIIAYTVSGGLAGLAGVMYAAYLPAASPSVGTAYELYAIAAAVLGGCSLRGGEGSVLGVVIGACIMRVMSNGIVLMGISTFWENTVIGAVIITAAILDAFVQRRRR